MTPKEELAIEDFKYQLAIGKLVLQIGEDLIEERADPKDFFNLKSAIQFHKLFLYEYGKENSDYTILRQSLNLMDTLLSGKLPTGTLTVYDNDTTTPAPRILSLVLTGDGSGGGPVDTSGFTSTIKIPKSAFTQNYTYINYGLMNVEFTLTISGGITLRPDKDYEVYATGGFRLINGVSMADTDVITLTAVKLFNSIPLDPDNPEIQRYVEDDYVDEDYVE